MANYVKNKDLYHQIVLSRDASVATPELLDMFFLISERLSYKFKYKRAEDRDDCIMSGVEDAWMYFWNFDPSVSSNAFAYVTQIIKNGMAKANRKLYSPYFQKEGYQQISLSLNTVYTL